MEERDRYRYRLHTQKKVEQEQEEKRIQIEHRCLLLRWMMAGMLFLVLALAFYFDFSYHGFNKEYVESWLQNDTLWEMTVTKIQHYLSVVGR